MASKGKTVWGYVHDSVGPDGTPIRAPTADPAEEKLRRRQEAMRELLGSDATARAKHD